MRINKGFFFIGIPFYIHLWLAFSRSLLWSMQKAEVEECKPNSCLETHTRRCPWNRTFIPPFFRVCPSSEGEQGLKSHFTFGEGKTPPCSSPSCSEWKKEPISQEKPFFQSPDPMSCGDHRGWVTLKLLR